MSKDNPLVRKNNRVDIDLGMIDLLLDEQLYLFARPQYSCNIRRNITHFDARRSFDHLVQICAFSIPNGERAVQTFATTSFGNPSLMTSTFPPFHRSSIHCPA